MAIYNSVAQVLFKGTLLGENCQTLLLYIATTAQSNGQSQPFATEARDNIWAALKPMLHQNYRLGSIRAQLFQIPGSLSKPPYELTIGENGDVSASECLPPNVTVRVIKFPDNATIDPPTGAPNFSNGWVGWSGIPEGQQKDGLLESAFVSGWNAVGEAMEELTVNFPVVGDVTYTLAMFRTVAVGGVLPKVMVSETEVSQFLGTRNSRKRH